MQIHHLHSLGRILEDFQFLLTKRLGSLVWKYDQEPEPWDFDLSLNAAIPHKTWESFYQKDVCTLCHRRISYKAGQFETRENVQVPLLILVHNAFLSAEGRAYHEPNAEREFQNLLAQSWGEAPESFLTREVLRCHFGSEEVQNQEWFKNCQTHIQNDIEKYSIRGIWIAGEAALLIFKDKNEINERMKKITPFMGLPTLVTYGPSRVVYMQKKKYPKEKIEGLRKEILEQIMNFKQSHFADQH